MVRATQWDAAVKRPREAVASVGVDGVGTLASAVYVKIRTDITRGALLPGAALRIRDLCEHYRVGASPVREALNRLASEALVLQVDQRGFHVAPVSREALVELTDTRCRLVEIAQRDAIASGDRVWEESVVLACHRLCRTSPYSAVDPVVLNVEWEPLHRAFHSALIAACPSRWLKSLYEYLSDQAERYRSLARLLDDGPNRKRDEEHRGIMEATIARDADRAVGLMKKHFWTTTDILLARWGELTSGISTEDA